MWSDSEYYPPGLLWQWHITERCNLRCTHCYQDDYHGEELCFEALLNILEQFKNFLALPCAEGNPPIPGHITVTGGEPFIRRDFFDLLEIFAANRKHFSFAVLTNGTLTDAGTVRRLRSLKPSFVQVSIEGSRNTHDRIRGQGNFDRTCSATSLMVRAGIRTLISFTAHRANFREFSQVARLGRRLKVSRVWADRLIPQGNGCSEQCLNPEETREFFTLMAEERRRAKRAWFNRTEIAMSRALQFLIRGGKPYHCTAGDTLITIQPNGDLYPCRRMPVSVGNVMKTPLCDLYCRSEFLRELRRRDRVSAGCEECFYAKFCRGGLKCLSYAMKGDLFQADPGCWRSESGNEAKSRYEALPDLI